MHLKDMFRTEVDRCMSIYLGNNLVSGGGGSSGPSLKNLYIFGYFLEDYNLYFPDLDIEADGSLNISDILANLDKYADIQFLIPSFSDEIGPYDVSTATPDDNYYTVGRISTTADDSLPTLTFVFEHHPKYRSTMYCTYELNSGKGYAFIEIPANQRPYIIRGYWNQYHDPDSGITLEHEYSAQDVADAVRLGRDVIMRICASPVSNWDVSDYRSEDSWEIATLTYLADDSADTFTLDSILDGYICELCPDTNSKTVSVTRVMPRNAIVDLDSIDDGTSVPAIARRQAGDTTTLILLRYGGMLFHECYHGKTATNSKWANVDGEVITVLCVSTQGEIYESHRYELDLIDVAYRRSKYVDYEVENVNSAYVLTCDGSQVSDPYSDISENFSDGKKIRLIVPQGVADFEDTTYMYLVSNYIDSQTVEESYYKFEGDSGYALVYQYGTIDINRPVKDTIVNVTCEITSGNADYDLQVRLPSWECAENLSGMKDNSPNVKANLIISVDTCVSTSFDLFIKDVQVKCTDKVYLDQEVTIGDLSFNLHIELKSDGMAEGSLRLLTGSRLNIELYESGGDIHWSHSIAHEDYQSFESICENLETEVWVRYYDNPSFAYMQLPTILSLTPSISFVCGTNLYVITINDQGHGTAVVHSLV